MSFRCSFLVAVLVLAAGPGTALAAAYVGSGPVLVGSGASYDCSVVNLSGADLPSVKVDITIAGATTGSGSTITCAPLAPNARCTASNDAGFAEFRFCTATVSGNRKAVRGTFCDMSSGQCAPLQ